MKTLFHIPQKRSASESRWRVLRVVAAVLSITFLYLAVFAVAALFARYPQPPLPRPAGALRGAYHVHSNKSDGKGTLEEIVQAANDAQRSFVILTDHNQESAPPAAFVNGVLVIFGNELTTPAGHVVALGASRSLTTAERQTGPLSKVTELGGFTVLAHPVQERNPWMDWSAASRAAGLELYSADSMFRSALVDPLFRLGPALGSFPVNRPHALMILVQPQAGAGQQLLDLAQDAPKLGLCAVDAHGTPPYTDIFRALSLYVPSADPLPQDPGVAAKQLLGAIHHGQSFCVFEHLGDATGFAIHGLSDTVRQSRVGDRLQIQLPQNVPLQTRVEITGPAILEADGKTVLMSRPGAVQIEIWALAPGRFFRPEWKPWIVPSPIWVYAGDADRIEAEPFNPTQAQHPGSAASPPAP